MGVLTRSFALAIVVALLFVPALTRVHQRLQHLSTAGTLISSYSKSAEAPPEKLLTAPPAVVVAIVGIIVDAVAPPRVGTERRDAVLPSGPPALPDALRAPPLA